MDWVIPFAIVGILILAFEMYCIKRGRKNK